MKGMTQGLVCETMKLLTLKNTESLFMGRSWPIEPSRNFLFIRVQGRVWPSESLQKRLVAPQMKGMAQLAAQALQIMTLGAVRQLSRRSSSCSPLPVTVILRIYPNLSNASWKVISPRLSLRKSFNTLMSMTQPSLATLLKCFHRDSFFLLTKAVKFILLPSKNYSLERVAIMEAIILPALLPAMMVGMQSASIRVCTTPMWYMPRMAPPLSSSALRPTECLSSPKNYSFLRLGISDLRMVLRHRTTSSWYSSINFLVELQASRYSSWLVILPTLRELCDRRMVISFMIQPLLRALCNSFLSSSIQAQSQQGEQTLLRLSWIWGSASCSSAILFHSSQLLASLNLASISLIFFLKVMRLYIESAQNSVISRKIVSSSTTSCLMVQYKQLTASSINIIIIPMGLNLSNVDGQVQGLGQIFVLQAFAWVEVHPEHFLVVITAVDVQEGSECFFYAPETAEKTDALFQTESHPLLDLPLFLALSLDLIFDLFRQFCELDRQHQHDHCAECHFERGKSIFNNLLASDETGEWDCAGLNYADGVSQFFYCKWCPNSLRFLAQPIAHFVPEFLHYLQRISLLLPHHRDIIGLCGRFVFHLVSLDFVASQQS